MRHYYAAAVIGLIFASCDLHRGGPTVEEFPEDSAMAGIAESLCQRFSDCECDEYTAGQNDELACEESAAALAQTWVETAREAGLTYGGKCMTSSQGRECGDTGRGGCQIYYGTVGDGGPCMAFGRYMSTCSSGSSCGVDGRCHSSNASFPRAGLEGDRCGAALGDYNIPCLDGLACLDGRCVVAADMGAGCDSGVPCDTGGWCSEGTCMNVLAPGEVCGVHEACESGICDEGQCAEEQPLGCVGFSW